MELPVIYEDDDLVAINKPAGVMMHPDGHSLDETASEWFEKAYPDSATVGETQRLKDGTEIARPGVVHRLDRDTSGVLVFAKTADSHAHLKELFQNREAKKTYLAFVYGTLKEEKGVIDFAIGRSRKDFRLRSAQPKAKGMMRDARTAYEVVGSIGTHSLVKVMPETGRTHQIRVHLKAIHHSVVCDPLYSPGKPCDLGLASLGLHAYQLELPGKPLLIAPVPKSMQKALGTFPEGAQFVAE
ncbi:RluA family pseudouridine synthase [Patescibacteria group bacterium]|nr:RluA family pseudouridine synthase [Patescibacteria group bacterium]MBU1500587.1 RluA family pseudouridine synthase [Patescibacteria group bacterium]MBU2080372.1 RluA family pseudouridine synthase [Patescibacteria group bacterium]MBU2124216.1 RluA family pseudouridine synthase [Patescibacteria group bacterium]MBU2194333.1 RluA family pseudouridine synthase [Patescibacteria group bacterium]